MSSASSMICASASAIMKNPPHRSRPTAGLSLSIGKSFGMVQGTACLASASTTMIVRLAPSVISFGLVPFSSKKIVSLPVGSRRPSCPSGRPCAGRDRCRASFSPVAGCAGCPTARRGETDRKDRLRRDNETSSARQLNNGLPLLSQIAAGGNCPLRSFSLTSDRATRWSLSATCSGTLAGDGFVATLNGTM